MRRVIVLLMAVCFILSACGRESADDGGAVQSKNEQNISDFDRNEESITVEKKLVLLIDGQKIPVNWENNASVAEIVAYASENTIHVNMSMYGGWEQVGHLGRSISRNDTQITTQNGDIVLYSGNQIVVFYGSNSWSYTKLGHIALSSEEVTALLDKDNVTLTLEAN